MDFQENKQTEVPAQEPVTNPDASSMPQPASNEVSADTEQSVEDNSRPSYQNEQPQGNNNSSLHPNANGQPYQSRPPYGNGTPYPAPQQPYGSQTNISGQNSNAYRSNSPYGNQYPNENGNLNGNSFPNGNPYQERNGYQNGNGYSNVNAYQNGSAYQNDNAYQNGSAYQNDNAYQNGNSYPNSGAYQNGNSYQNSGAYQNGNSYPNGSAYQDRNSYPNGSAYQNRNSYPNGSAYQNGNSYQNNNYNNNYPYYNRNTYQIPASEPGSSLAQAAMVCGILSIVLCLTFTVYPAFVLGSVAILLALLSKGRRSNLFGKARIGVICAAVGLVMNAIIIVSSIAYVFTNPEQMEEFNEQWEKIYGVPFDEMMDEMMGNDNPVD